MPLAIKVKSGDAIVRVVPDPDEIGLVAIRKLLMTDGLWAVTYGGQIIKGGFATEDLADLCMCNLLAWLNTVQAGSAKTVSEIEALS